MPRTWPDLTVEYVTELADRWERRDRPVIDRINRREQVYHSDWRVAKIDGREYFVNQMPKIVADRAVDRLCAQPPLLKVQIDEAAVQAEEDQGFEELHELSQGKHLRDRGDRQRTMLERQAEAAREHGEQVEAILYGLWLRLSKEQRANFTRLMARSGVVDGYVVARVIALADDEVHDGELPLRIMVLDPRCYHDRPAKGGGRPEEVIYSRRATARALRDEGWEVDIGECDERDEAEAEYRLIDYWRKVRVKRKRQWVTEVWHAIVIDDSTGADEPRSGGEYGHWAKQPTRMPIADIPYTIRRARPAPLALRTQTGDYQWADAQSFIEFFAHDETWEQLCKIDSWRAQIVRLAVEPPSVVKTKGQPKEVDTNTPGAQSTVDVGESVELLVREGVIQQVQQLDNALRDQAEKATFAGASLGQGVYQSSGIMTERLQEAGSQSLTAFREVVQEAHEDVFGLLAMMARVYLKGQRVKLPGLGRTVLADFSVLSGEEILDVRLPGLSNTEMMQILQGAKTLAQPDQDGWPFISADTAWEVGGLPYPRLEQKKILEQKLQRSDWMLDLAEERFWAGRTSELEFRKLLERRQRRAEQGAPTGTPPGGAGPVASPDIGPRPTPPGAVPTPGAGPIRTPAGWMWLPRQIAPPAPPPAPAPARPLGLMARIARPISTAMARVPLFRFRR